MGNLVQPLSGEDEGFVIALYFLGWRLSLSRFGLALPNLQIILSQTGKLGSFNQTKVPKDMRTMQEANNATRHNLSTPCWRMRQTRCKRSFSCYCWKDSRTSQLAMANLDVVWRSSNLWWYSNCPTMGCNSSTLCI